MKTINISQTDYVNMMMELSRSIVASHWIPERIAGIGRGGLAPAVMLSHFFNVPMISIDISLRDFENCTSNSWAPIDAQDGLKTLIVDDINDSGATFAWIKQDWDSAVAGQPIAWHDMVRFAAMIDNESSNFKIDYRGRSIDKEADPSWIIFPWENWWLAK